MSIFSAVWLSRLYINMYTESFSIVRSTATQLWYFRVSFVRPGDLTFDLMTLKPQPNLLVPFEIDTAILNFVGSFIPEL